MVTSRQANDSANDPTSDLLAIIEDCFNNYASDVHLFQSPLTTWEVVRCRLPAGAMSTPEQLALTVRAVLDELIDALRSSETLDLNSPSVRRYIIADQLYRRGLKQTEICPSHLPLSKSQFYRERTETLVTLANYIQRWEQRTIEHRKLRAIKTLAMASPAGSARLVGVDSLLSQLTTVLTNAQPPKLILLSGLGGVGKTAVAQAAVEQVLHTNQFHALAWINCQRDRFTGTHVQTSDAAALTTDDLFNHLLRQLRPNPISDSCLFDRISVEVGDERVTFDQVLGFLHQELDRQEPCHLPLSEKRSLVMDLLWAVPTLIVVDGLEAVAGMQGLIDELWHLASRTSVKVLITSRARSTACHDVKHFDMRGLVEADAMHLLRTYAVERGIEAVEKASPEDLCRLANAACGNPLVIQWMVNQLAVLPLQQVLSAVSAGTGDGSEVYQFIYGNVWEALSVPARQVLVTIARSAASGAAWEPLQRSTGLRPETLNRSLQELVAASLVIVSAHPEPCYQVASTTRAFALVASADRPVSRRALHETYRPSRPNEFASRVAYEDTYRR